MYRNICVLFVCLYAPTLFTQPMCRYHSFRWNVPQQKAVLFETVVKPYASLDSAEVHRQSGCSVCLQDQVWIRLPGVDPFLFCKQLAPELEATLSALLDEGVAIFSIKGYQVGRTRGQTDDYGNRVGFSNHSYGIAIDINPEQNGLYTNCTEFSPRCRLLRGGHWNPAVPGTWRANGPVVRALEQIGLKWGGAIAGKQKDFMHFSPSGY